MTSENLTFTQTRWSLYDLFQTGQPADLESVFTLLEQKVAAFETIRPQLSADLDNDTFLGFIRQMEVIDHAGNRLYSYASLWFAEDTQNQAAQSLMARVDQFFAGLGNRMLFFNLWWKDLPDEDATRLMAASGDYRYWLEEMRHFKPHTLSEAEEKIINIKNVTGSSALGTLYDAMTNRYTFKLTVDGQEREMTRGELMVYAYHYDPALRAAAYQELYRVYGQDGPILGQVYQTLVRDWRNEQVLLRGFQSPLAARNLANDIPDEVVDTLLEVCRQNVSIFQRFFRLKARWLGVERLRRYDVYAPVVQSDKEYDFQQAAQMVMDSFRQFDPRFEELALRVFKADHVDSEVRKGKRGGAFCLTAANDITPWVQLNYQHKVRDISTMAHELGHAIHSMLAAGHSLFTFHASLPLAETASTFGEMMLVDQLLKQETDEAVRRDLLFSQVDDAYATIARQAFFALFERQAHEMIDQGASVDELAEAYLQNLHELFGDAVDVSDEFRWEWVSIPHIYNVPFYVYAYSFGQLLVLSLYQQYRREGESFKPRYIKILSTGGAESPAHILEEAGIDIRQASFWQGGFDVVREMVAELEALPVQPLAAGQ
ncbi:MAG: M3 family oligoendopeptidase [Chloroflexi bacterium]|nr:M3 family oligoendopeptidase [Anaerolineaceae bacterium]NMB89508.1 M3 family oligoendopeptidase [Chloroflexota bacterium]